MATIWETSSALYFRVVIPSSVFFLVNTDDLDMLSHPFRRKVYPSAVSALFNLFLDHLFAIDFEFRPVSDIVRLLRDFHRKICFHHFLFLLLGHDRLGQISREL